jgi:hypothetical protein
MASFIQSFHPLEHRTPPLPLVALFGLTDVFKDIADFFSQSLKPPLVSTYNTSEATELLAAKLFGSCFQTSSHACDLCSTSWMIGPWLSMHVLHEGH